MGLRQAERPTKALQILGHADEGSRKSVSCTVRRNGKRMLECSVAKHGYVALSSGYTEFSGIVRAAAIS